jgi:ABC-2 type transport system permease protein
MNFERVSALIERDMRKFFRSPALMVSSLIFPLVQLIVLGYAFGGKIKGAKVAFVDQDHSVLSRRVREMFDGVSAGPATFKVVNYDSETQAVDDLRAGFVRGVVELPPHFSEKFYDHDRPQIAFSEDNTDQVMASALQGELQSIVTALNAPVTPSRLDGQVELDVVEVYPYVEYAKYLLAGSTSMAIFIVAMIGGGITFIDDKSRGLHEGYLLTPIKKSELVTGLIGAGALKGLMAGMSIVIIGGMIVGIPGLWDPMRILYLCLVTLVASVAMISLMFVAMVRVSDPLVPRAVFGVLNMLLFFPSGAISPIEGFPKWLRWMSVVDPFTYTVHALRDLTVKNTGIEGIYRDVLLLAGFSIVMIAISIALFKRQI